MNIIYLLKNRLAKFTKYQFVVIGSIAFVISLGIYHMTFMQNYINNYLSVRNKKKVVADAVKTEAMLAQIKVAFEIIGEDPKKGLSIMKGLADKGFPFALVLLGGYHIFGQYGAEKNLKKGVELIENGFKKEREKYLENNPYSSPDKFKGILKSDSHSWFCLGNAYLKGDTSLNVDLNKAVKYLDKAATMGNNGACHLLVQGYLYGYYGVTKKPLKGLEYASQAADRGYVWAQLNLGLAHMGVPFTSDIAQDIEKATKYLTLAANNTSSEVEDIPHIASANKLLGSMYLDGTYGIKVDQVKGVEFMHKASRLRNLDATTLLGLAYFLGRHGLSVNYKKAEELLFIAADAGDVSAQCTLGIQYILGAKFPKDIKMGLMFLHKAAAKNEYNAHMMLGNVYILGNSLDIQQNVEKGLKHLKIAADAGNPQAQTQLARIFAEGTLVDKDLKQAQKYFAKAAVQGHEEALAATK